MTKFVWTLSVMDQDSAEPVAVLDRPFTRFERSRMEAAVRALEAWGTHARFDQRRIK